MVNKRWTLRAYESLKSVHDYHSDNPEYAKKVVDEILNKVDTLHFAKQYQIDEILGPPYRRIMMKNYRIVYRVLDDDHQVEILQILANRQSLGKTKRTFNK